MKSRIEYLHQLFYNKLSSPHDDSFIIILKQIINIHEFYNQNSFDLCDKFTLNYDDIMVAFGNYIYNRNLDDFIKTFLVINTV